MVSTTDLMVETLLYKLRDTSGTSVVRAYSIFVYNMELNHTVTVVDPKISQVAPCSAHNVLYIVVHIYCCCSISCPYNEVPG